MKNFIQLLLIGCILPPLLGILGGASIAKIVDPLLCWSALFLAMETMQVGKWKAYSSKYIFWTGLLFVYGVFQMLRSIPQGEILTLFGNPLVCLWLLLPIFGLVPMFHGLIFDVNKSLLISCLAAFVLFLLGGGVEQVLGCYMLFLPYLWFLHKRRWEKFVVVLGLIAAVLWSFSKYGQRYSLIMVAMSLVIFVITELLNNKKMVVLYCFSLITIVFLSIIYYCFYDVSVFSLLHYFSSNEEMNIDTRTFLYEECVSDLFKKGDWIIGKGALGRYHSVYFYLSNSGEGDFWERISVEVGILMLFLKGGILYVILYLSIVLHAIWNALKFGNNRFCLFFACILSSHIFMLFIYDAPIFGLKYFIYWMIISLCHNQSFLNMNNKQLSVFYSLTARK